MATNHHIIRTIGHLADLSEAIENYRDMAGAVAVGKAAMGELADAHSALMTRADMLKESMVQVVAKVDECHRDYAHVRIGLED